VNRLVQRLGRRRLTDEERARHDAFLDEIAAHEAPTSGRWLTLRSQAVHATYRLFGGGPTLAQVAVAGVILGVGSALIALAPTPHTAGWDDSVPQWVQAAITLGVFGLAIDLARSPRELHPRRFTRWAALPLGIALALGIASFHVALVPDWILRVGLAIAVAGFLSISAGAIARRPRLVRNGLVLVGVGAAGTSLSDGVWGVLFVIDDDLVLAVGCVLASLGAALIAIGLIRSWRIPAR
jgi:hypothetical protein